MRKRLLALPSAALALGLLGMAPAQAHDHGAVAQTTQQRQAGTAVSASPKSKSLFFTAKLDGAQEVPTPGGPAVGDDDGSAKAVIRVKGSQVSFALEYEGIGAPTLGHIHQGEAGTNGGVKVALFGTPLPATVDAVAGAVTVDDPATADAIRTDPSGFYVNLHSAEFPGGAVRGQLKPLKKRADLLDLIRGGKLRAYLSGDQEVPVAGGKAVGDPDGRAVAFVRAKGDTVGYSLAFIGVTPTLGHIHQGKFGVNGDVKVGLFGTAVPATVFAMSGTVADVDPAVVRQIREAPKSFYVNLHSADFPGGAVRGQLHRR